MRRSILCGALLSAVFLSHDQALQAHSLEVSWLTQYGGESLQTVNLPTAPWMIANISNSLMTAAPSYLDDAIYLQRRSNFTSNYTQYNGIGETSQEWLRADRVSINQEAVVVVAVRESVFPVPVRD